MFVSDISAFKIESEIEADDYLSGVLAKPEYRSVGEVKMRAQKYIDDERIRNYFIKRGMEILKTYGQETESVI